MQNMLEIDAPILFTEYSSIIWNYSYYWARKLPSPELKFGSNFWKFERHFYFHCEITEKTKEYTAQAVKLLF